MCRRRSSLYRVDALLRRQVLGVGDAPAGGLAGMDLDQLAPIEHLDQLAGRPGPRRAADQVARHRVEGLGHLDVVVPVHLGGGVERQVIGRSRRGQQSTGPPRARTARPGGTGWCRACAVPHGSRHHCSARRWASARSMKAHRQRTIADEGHGAFDPGLVCRVTHPCRVDQEAPGLGVLDEGLVEAGARSGRPCRRRSPCCRGSPP